MTNKIFTIGYTGAKPVQIKQLLDDRDALLFDIRFSPRSRVPHWNKNKLAEAIGPSRYVHCKALGNVNYKGGPIAFVDFDAGVELIKQSSKPVVLMCACQEAARCHRTAAAEKLKDLGFEVEEVDVRAISDKPGAASPFQQTSFLSRLL